MEERNFSAKVCVTGGSSYIGSWLIKKLLEKGYTIHATVRNLDEKIKVDLLKSLPCAETRLLLVQADIYNPTEFEAAIQVVWKLLQLYLNFEYKDTTEAAIAGVRSIADSCIRSQTVKRLIYTASVMASSPLKQDGTGYKSALDESCWTPLNLSYTFSNDSLLAYTSSKTLAEKEVLSYNEIENGKLEVVSLPCALVGGDTLLSYMPSSMADMLSQITGNPITYNDLRFLQELLGSIPLVHIDDVCDAHIFCMEKQQSLRGRFLCAADDPTMQEMGQYYRENFPQFKISEELMGGPERGSRCDNTKLVEMGFEYKYDMKKILDDSVDCGIRLQVISSN